MSCYPKLAWPNCNPGAGVYDCSDPTLKSGCCLSAQTTDKTKSNCPAGWTSNPAADEWCTDSYGILSKSKYRHKCKRTSCPNSLMDPSTNCTTCVNSMLDPKTGCKTCASNPMLAAPDCKVCSNSLMAPPSCTACLNPKQTLCNGACVDMTSDGSNCGACGKSCGKNTCINSGCYQACGPNFCALDEKCGLDFKCVKGDNYSVTVQRANYSQYTSNVQVFWTTFPYPIDLNVDNVHVRLSPILIDGTDIIAKATASNSQFSLDTGFWMTSFDQPLRPYIGYRVFVNVNGKESEAPAPFSYQPSGINPDN